ncbi:hypothetical protein LTR78_009200 [Recurvomyces mirabilis]|uniref:Uncharacterized protein n=1 Tax=Recurvomyces mirabilis TaxID=574656 RepID=A0AAE0TNZ3_9PEZI|nr:hypothetical protein LTR78_009200 [Recurvomyces mirabilis]KAK5155640.1 hypothetical protein LTS14_005901 [Recurvomyces mirabilis]
MTQPISGEEGHGIGLIVDLQTPERHWSLVEYLSRTCSRRRSRSGTKTGNVRASANQAESPLKRAYSTQNHHKSARDLCAPLSRFAQIELPNGKGRFETSKIDDNTVIEEYLNLAEFTDSEEPLFYRLDSAVAHQSVKPDKKAKTKRATTIDGGHYIAAVREQSGRSSVRSMTISLLREIAGAKCKSCGARRPEGQDLECVDLSYREPLKNR